MILVKVFEGVQPDAPVEASTLPTKSGLIKSKHILSFPGGMLLSILGLAFKKNFSELCHINVTAYAYGGAKG